LRSKKIFLPFAFCLPRIEILGYKIIVPTELKNQKHYSCFSFLPFPLSSFSFYFLPFALPRAYALRYKIHRSYGTEKPIAFDTKNYSLAVPLAFCLWLPDSRLTTHDSLLPSYFLLLTSKGLPSGSPF